MPKAQAIQINWQFTGRVGIMLTNYGKWHAYEKKKKKCVCWEKWWANSDCLTVVHVLSAVNWRTWHWAYVMPLTPAGIEATEADNNVNPDKTNLNQWSFTASKHSTVKHLSITMTRTQWNNGLISNTCQSQWHTRTQWNNGLISNTCQSQWHTHTHTQWNNGLISNTCQSQWHTHTMEQWTDIKHLSITMTHTHTQWNNGLISNTCQSQWHTHTMEQWTDIKHLSITMTHTDTQWNNGLISNIPFSFTAVNGKLRSSSWQWLSISWTVIYQQFSISSWDDWTALKESVNTAHSLLQTAMSSLPSISSGSQWVLATTEENKAEFGSLFSHR